MKTRDYQVKFTLSEFLIELIGYILFKAQLLLAAVEHAGDGRNMLEQYQRAGKNDEPQDKVVIHKQQGRDHGHDRARKRAERHVPAQKSRRQRPAQGRSPRKRGPRPHAP